MADETPGIDFVSIAQSPWSLKARWALNFCEVPYNPIEFASFIDAPKIRRRMGRKGIVSVPLLFESNSGPLIASDSIDIAKYADGIGKKELFPVDSDEEIRKWNKCCDELLSYSRGLFLRRVIDAGDTVHLAPTSVQRSGWLGKAVIAPTAVKIIMKKYSAQDGKVSKEMASAHLQSVRKALEGGKKYLVGDYFTFADIAVACSTCLMRQVPDEFVKWGTWLPLMKHLGLDDLDEEYTDVTDWAAWIFEEHFKQPKIPLS